MSTAGKVLCILITLPALLWVWLASGVSEMNRNWGKQIDSLEASVAKTSEDLEATVAEVGSLTSKISLVQREQDYELTVMRADMAQLFKYESISKETQDRYTKQLASVVSSAEAAERRFQRAELDLAESTKELADARVALAAVKEANTNDRSTLAQLREQFSRLLSENKALVEKALQSQQARTGIGGSPTLAR
jgi:chromosome segregation ATPase